MIKEILIIAGCSVALMLTGAVLVRYGIGLGQKLTIAAQNDLPLGKHIPPLLQEHTGDDNV